MRSRSGRVEREAATSWRLEDSRSRGEVSFSMQISSYAFGFSSESSPSHCWFSSRPVDPARARARRATAPCSAEKCEARRMTPCGYGTGAQQATLRAGIQFRRLKIPSVSTVAPVEPPRKPLQFRWIAELAPNPVTSVVGPPRTGVIHASGVPALERSGRTTVRYTSSVVHMRLLGNSP